MKTLLPLLALILFGFSAPMPSVEDDWKNKVDKAVLLPAENGEEVEWLIYLNQQADVSLAQSLQDKTDKGSFVYERLSALAKESQVNIIRTLERHEASYRSYWIVNAVWAKGRIDLIEALARLPEVQSLQVNPSVQFEAPRREEDNADQARSRAIEWGILKMAADQVWAMGYTGQNIVIGGQDTGVEWDHPAIKSQYRGWNGSSANHNYNWYDAIHSAGGSNPCGSDSPFPCDDHNHGTHTVGTMVGDDGGSNQIGMAPGAKWIACRNMDRGAGTPTTYIECFQWFLAPTDLNGDFPDPSKAPHVINNSWSCPSSEGCNPGNYATMEAAINNLRSAGVVVVVSAGNSGNNCSTVNAPPAIFNHSFTVGSTNSSDNIAGSSSRGPVTVDGSNRMKPDISAPGVSVRSCIRNNNYAVYSGTSMAGPHIAGAVALMISADPTISGNANLIESTLTSTAVARTTGQTCGGTSGSSIPNNTYGYGRSDALAAVNDLLQALPVELLQFEAIAAAQQVNLYWQTAREWNHDHFIIEKSRDLNNWESIGRISKADDQQRYSFEDVAPWAGINYYRLKQVGLDASFEYSKVVSVNVQQTSNWSVYPNPISDELYIEISELKNYRNISLAIYQASGQLLQEQSIDLKDAKDRYVLNSSDWPKGIFFVVLSDEKGKVIGQERVLKL